MANVVEHRKFSLTNLGNNNNKFWNVTLYDNGDVVSHWGRQGDPPRETPWHGVGRAFMEKKIREKEKKGYRENETIESTEPSRSPSRSVSSGQLQSIARQQISAKSPVVSALIDYLVRVNAHNIGLATGGKITYDASTATFKTTQGVVVPHQVDRAAQLLITIADVLAKGKGWDYSTESDVNEYLSLIPRDFGRRRITPDTIFPDLAAVQRENDLLDGLRASFAGVVDASKKKTKKKTTKKAEPKIFEVELELVTDPAIIKHCKNLFHSTKKSGHHGVYGMDIKTVHAVSIATMKRAFDAYGATLQDIRELWHGTKASNLLSILKGGLIIPPSSSGHVTGRMYGDGLYFSCVSTKALNYATNFWGGGGRTDRTFMFLAQVAMGNYYLAGSGWGSYPKRGYQSTWAKGGRSGVINDEMIVYRTDQANLIYLCEFSK